MGCLVLPIPPLPTLPPGIGLGIPIPGPPDLNLPDFCCKSPDINKFIKANTPPLPYPYVLLNPAVIATLNGYITAVNTYLRSIPINCPLE